MVTSLTRYSKLIGKLVRELSVKYDSSSILVFRGAVFEIDIVGHDVIPRKFLGFIGTSSSLLIVRVDGGLNVCNVSVIKEPIVFRNKLREKGLFRLISCSRDVEIFNE